MRKYSISGIGVLIAIIAFSFSLPEKKKNVTYNFTFTGNVTIEAQVEDEQNHWALYTGTFWCDNVDHVAGKLLFIPEEFTELVGNPVKRKMKTIVDIQSAIASGHFPKRYVSSVYVGVVGEVINNCSDF
jgi:hypothetical protein